MLLLCWLRAGAWDGAGGWFCPGRVLSPLRLPVLLLSRPPCGLYRFPPICAAWGVAGVEGCCRVVYYFASITRAVWFFCFGCALVGVACVRRVLRPSSVLADCPASCCGFSESVLFGPMFGNAAAVRRIGSGANGPNAPVWGGFVQIIGWVP